MFKLVAPLTIQKYTIDGVPYLCGPPNNGGRTFTVSFKGGLAGCVPPVPSAPPPPTEERSTHRPRPSALRDEEWTIFAPSQTAFKCDPVQGLSTRGVPPCQLRGWDKLPTLRAVGVLAFQWNWETTTNKNI